MIKAEYIWIDGGNPTPALRSKTKIIEKGADLPIWGFDGSSTQQASGEASDCVLNPVFTCPDPIRQGDNILVMCEVLNTDMTPHVSNTRKECSKAENKYGHHKPIFGLEQEYTFFMRHVPLGFYWLGSPDGKEIGIQGQYYCSVGNDNAIGREIAEEHLDACLAAGLQVGGINAEVMPGQWEFQIGPLPPTDVSDQLWVARWLLSRIAEGYNISVSLDPKPAQGDWNGAGCHTNFSTTQMRSSIDYCYRAIGSLEKEAPTHIKSYGHDIEQRLTGQHETCPYDEFRYGVSDRGASIRIPWQVHADGKGYIEDRRPNANCDPYKVTRLITTTVCSKF